MPQVLDWLSAAESADVVQVAARALRAGWLVAFPTETFYAVAVSALVPEAVARLRQVTGRPASEPLTLVLRGAGDALDWVPAMSPVGRRLARRCWPGPVKLVFADGMASGLAGRLSADVRHHLSPAGSLGLCVPGHEALRLALHLVPGPLVAAGARRGEGLAAVSADQVWQAFGEDVDLILDGGPTRHGQPATMVCVNGNSWSLGREGVVTAADLQRLTACRVVFVCTGNTCRSPLAEALCKRRLAERLGCSPEELPQRGFDVQSAGVAALAGGPAADEAVEAARAFGADLSGHQSQPLTARLVALSDFVVSMTHSHLRTVAEQVPNPAARLRLLSPEGQDLADPIGGDQEVYRECAQQIWQHLEGLVAELIPP